MNSASGTDDPAGGLEGLRAAVAAGNPDLYRHVALYLQVLRSVLPARVEQACFHLATQVHVQRYLNLPESQRRELHQSLREQISRCCSLLTVEQLVALARRLEQTKQQQQRQRQQELLQRLLQQRGHDNAPSEATGQSQQGPQREAPADDSRPLPPGSVRLELASPLDGAGLPWTQGHPASETLLAAHWGSEAPGDGEPSPSGPSGADGEPNDTAASEAEDGSQRQEGDADLMAALIQGLIEAGALDGAEVGESEDAAGKDARANAARSGAADGGAGPARQAPRQEESEAEPEALILESGLSSAGEHGPASGSPWDEPGLPRDPLLLLRWLDGLEAALVRRLRNLSHAINVDLLRLGLSPGLLPMSLLEAVLQGQIETLASPANLLRLQLPFGLRPGAPPLQAIAVLLRPVDLEMEEARLRTCRRRIQQHRQQIRKMAQTYRRLQRRLQAHEAERLWLQDIRASRTAGP